MLFRDLLGWDTNIVNTVLREKNKINLDLFTCSLYVQNHNTASYLPMSKTPAMQLLRGSKASIN